MFAGPMQYVYILHECAYIRTSTFVYTGCLFYVLNKIVTIVVVQLHHKLVHNFMIRKNEPFSYFILMSKKYSLSKFKMIACIGHKIILV